MSTANLMREPNYVKPKPKDCQFFRIMSSSFFHSQPYERAKKWKKEKNSLSKTEFTHIMKNLPVPVNKQSYNKQSYNEQTNKK